MPIGLLEAGSATYICSKAYLSASLTAVAVEGNSKAPRIVLVIDEVEKLILSLRTPLFPRYRTLKWVRR